MSDTTNTKATTTADARLLKRRQVLAIDEAILKLRDAKATINMGGDPLPTLRVVQTALADLVVPSNG